MITFKHLNESFNDKFDKLLNESNEFELETLYKEMWDEFKDYVKSNGEKGSFEMWDGNEPTPSDKIGRKYDLMKLVLKDHGYKFETSGNGRGVHFEYWKDSKGKMPNEPITDKDLKKKRNESCEDRKPSKKKSKKPIKESFNPNTDFTKETLWQLRQEVPIGSLYTNEFQNSFGIPAKTCQAFFDGYMDELGYIMEEDGIDDSVFWDNIDEYDNPENLWDWYSGTEQPFGEDIEIEDGEYSARNVKPGYLTPDESYAIMMGRRNQKKEALDKGKFKRVKQPSKKPIKESIFDDEDFDKSKDELEKIIYDLISKNKKVEDIVGMLQFYEDAVYDMADNMVDESLKEARMYDLTPQRDSRKSFYGKAKVMINDDGSETLYSYNTPIMTRTKDGNYKKHWDGWSNTTGRHIAEFSGMNKKKYSELPVEESIKSRKKR